jgi:hypothetical protein
MKATLTRIIILLLNATQIVSGQNIIPPSPNAASLGKYADIPVGYHTGVPDISIPLHELKEGDVSLPVSLSYHPSGIRVSEVASWVGLGWSLNAGGVITRAVQHTPDEGPLPRTAKQPPSPYFSDAPSFYTGYYRDGFTLPENYQDVESFDANMQGASHATYNAMMDAAQGNSDTEPDIFFFNIGGYSGKFLFKVDVNKALNTITRTPVFIPRSDIKVEVLFGKTSAPNYPSGVEERETFTGFVLTMPNGFRYYFGGESATEYTNSQIYNFSSHSATADVVLAPSSWYLTRIESPTGRHIDLEYVRDTFGYYDLAPERCWSGDEYLTLQEQAISRAVVNGVKLVRISSGTEEVLFKAETIREDLSNYENQSGSEETDKTTTRRLDYIQVNRSDHSTVRKFLFNYSYFEGIDGKFPKFIEDLPGLKSLFTTDRKRLRLNGLTETSGDGTLSLPPYRFTYIDDQPLPRRMSYQQDHWGYYNHEINNTGLISFWVAPRKNRRDTNDQYTKIGTLKSIQYPTGGKTTFNYESHQAFATMEDVSTPDLGRNYPTDSWTAGGDATVSFSISHASVLSGPCLQGGLECNRFKIELKFRAGSPTGGTYDLAYNTIRTRTAIEIYRQGDSNPMKVYQFWGLDNCETANLLCSTSGQSKNFREISRDDYVDLPAGQYYAKTYRIDGVREGIPYAFTAAFNIFIPRDRDPNYRAPVINKLAKIGGLRIRSIVTSDGTGASPDQERIFSYPPGGGVLLSQPQYYYRIEYLFDNLNNPIRAMKGVTFNQLWASNSILPMRTTQGNHIGYGWVKEEQKGNGYKIYSFDVSEHPYHFNNDPWFKGNTYNYEAEGRRYSYPVYPPPMDLEKGNLLGVEIYNSQAKLVMSTYHTYEPTEDIFMMRASKVDFLRAPISELTFYIGYTHYPIFTATNRIKTTTVNTNFDANGSNPASVVTTYNYESPRHLQATSIVKTMDDVEYIDKFVYPPDYGNVATSAGGVRKLQQSNLINVPVEKYTIKRITGASMGSVINGSLAYFRSDLPVPDALYSLKVEQPIPESSFRRSNQTGNSINPDPLYEKRTLFNGYDDAGNILELSKDKDVHISYLWGYSKSRPIAEIRNATSLQVFHTSFEDLTGNYSRESKTGSKSYTGEYVARVPSAGTFNLTYWRKAGNDPWQLIQTTIASNTTIGGPGSLIDEVRIFPPDAQMTTYTYDSSFGMTSANDENNHVSYFQYDKLGRLTIVRDHDQNILKSYTYNYAED